MMLVEETAVAASALPIAEFRDHLRLGSGFADDGLQDAVLERSLRAAIAAIEARTGKILIEREFVWSVPAWRGVSEQVLPVAPVTVVDDVVLVDRLGAEVAVPRAAWISVADNQRPRIVALSGALPVIPQGGVAKVSFVAGFGPTWANLPLDLAQAVFILAAHYYEFRHGGDARADLPADVAALIARHRTVRLSGAVA